MKKLFCLLIMLMGSVLGMENTFTHLIPSVFRVPPFITRIAQYGARIFKLNELPIICQIKVPSGGTLAVTVPQFAIKDVLGNNSAKNSHEELLIKQVYASIKKPQDTIILFPLFFHRSNFFNLSNPFAPEISAQSYSTKKITLLHELWHVKQFQQQCSAGRKFSVGDDITIDQKAYPRGPEHEADMQAAHAANCRICTKNFGRNIASVSDSKKYATQAEFFKIANSIPQHQMCPYHTMMMSKLKKSDLLTHFVGSYIAGKFRKRIKEKYGLSIEEQIVRGEIEP